MKKTIILLLSILVVTMSHAQKDSTAKADTVATLETPLLSYNDVMNILGEQPLKCADPIRNEFGKLIQQRANEYYIRRKAELKGKKSN